MLTLSGESGMADPTLCPGAERVVLSQCRLVPIRLIKGVDNTDVGCHTYHEMKCKSKWLWQCDG